MMSTGMRTFFHSRVQKNFKSLYQSFVPQKFASVHVWANRCNSKNKFLVRSIQTRLDCMVKPLCPKSAAKTNILQNSDVFCASKVSLICSCDKVLKVAFVRCRWLYFLEGNVSGRTRLIPKEICFETRRTSAFCSRYPGPEPLISTLNTLTRVQHRAYRK